MKVIDRYLLKQIALPTAASLVLLFQLMIALQLLRRVDVLLGQSVRGRDVAALLWDLTPHYLVLALPIAVLLGTLIGFGQLSEDGEFNALASAGVSPLRLLAMPIALALAGSLVVLWLGLGPEARGMQRVRVRFDAMLKAGVQRQVRPGVFYDDVGGLTLFAESIDPATGDWRHVLVNDERDLRAPFLLLAERGHVRSGGPDESLVLDLGHGQIHRQQSTGDDYTALEFAEGSVAISVQDSLLRRNTLRSFEDERSLVDLWAAAHAQVTGAEQLVPQGVPQRKETSDLDRLQSAIAFHRRLGLVLASLALVWVGVPFALRPISTSARARGYLFAALSVVGYFVFLRLGTSLGMGQVVSPWLSGQLANGMFAMAGAAAWLRLRGGGRRTT